MTFVVKIYQWQEGHTTIPDFSALRSFIYCGRKISKKKNWVCCRYLHIHKLVSLMLQFLSSIQGMSTPWYKCGNVEMYVSPD